MPMQYKHTDRAALMVYRPTTCTSVAKLKFEAKVAAAI